MKVGKNRTMKNETPVPLPQAENFQAADEKALPLSRRPSRSIFRRIVWAAMILLTLTVVYYLLHFYRPLGRGPAGPTVDPAPFAEVWTDHKVVLLAYGDSITAGFGVGAPYGYVARLAENPPDEFVEMRGLCLKKVLPNLETASFALSGSTSIQHLAMLDKIPTYAPDRFGLIVLTAGGNDLIHNYGRTPPKEGAMYGATLTEAEPWIARFRTRLNALIDGLEAKFPGGCLIFIADIYDPSDGVGDPASVFLPKWPDCVEILARYNETIRTVADERDNLCFVPIHDEFLGHGIHCSEFWRRHYRRNDPTFWFAPILEDPNIRGFDAIRRLFLNEMVKRRGVFERLGKESGQLERPNPLNVTLR